MKLKSLFLTTTLVALTAAGANAALSTLDSSAFQNRYNGGDIFDGTNAINGWAGNGGNAGLATSGSNVSINLTENNGWIEHDNDATPWELGTGSWSVEVRAMVGANNGAGGFTIWGALNGERNIMTIRESSVTDLGGNVFSVNNNVGEFHDFRLVYDGDDDAYHYFRDGLMITPADGIGEQAGSGNTRLIIGDCCSNIAGEPFGGPDTIVELEYIRYDNTGAFAPVPEPASSVMLILGSMALFLRRRSV
jgi:hypothetical protein